MATDVYNVTIQQQNFLIMSHALAGCLCGGCF